MAEDISDEELRSQLALKGIMGVAITAQTRNYFLNKLRKMTGTPIHQEESPTEISSTKTQSPSEDCPGSTENGTGFYVLTRESTTIYQSPSDVVKAAKSLKGVRFKRFDTKNEAEQFLQTRTTCVDESTEWNAKRTLSEIERAKEIEKQRNGEERKQKQSSKNA